MKKTHLGLFVLVLALLAPLALAWNLEARYINALIFDKNGEISLTLFQDGKSGDELECEKGNVWFEIAACEAEDAVCIASVNRMSSMLLAAKMAGKPIHLERNGCLVTQTGLKP